MDERICKGCGKELALFLPKNVKYCSSDCRIHSTSLSRYHAITDFRSYLRRLSLTCSRSSVLKKRRLRGATMRVTLSDMPLMQSKEKIISDYIDSLDFSGIKFSLDEKTKIWNKLTEILEEGEWACLVQ